MDPRQPAGHRRLRAETLESRQLLHAGAFGGGEPPSAADRVARVFDRLDTNQDTVLTAADEINERLWERISAADLDDNGVSQEELVAHLEAQMEQRADQDQGPGQRFRRQMAMRGRGGSRMGPPRPSDSGDRLDAFFARHDENSDDLITADEVSERLWERLAEADLNDDGVSRDELEDFQEAQRAARFDAIFARLDVDDSGGLTQDEIHERHWARIAEADANDDGIVTKQELEDHREAKRAEREVA